MTGRTQLVLLVLTVLTLVSILRLVRSAKLKAKYSLLWITLGVALLALAVLPNVADRVATEVGVYYQPALFFVVGIGFLLLVVIHFSYELSRMENRIRTLTEESTLLRHDLRQLRDGSGAPDTTVTAVPDHDPDRDPKPDHDPGTRPDPTG
jgi:hypothetical protein